LPRAGRSIAMRTYRPGPHGQAPAVTWRQWLLPLGAAAGIVAILALSPSAPSGIPLSYSQFLNDVGAGNLVVLWPGLRALAESMTIILANPQVK
jgi:hypothetical protein